MSNGNGGTYMSVRDATGVELTTRVQVPYTTTLDQVFMTTLVSGVPVEMAFFDSYGNLLWTVPHTSPQRHQLTAGETFSLMTPPLSPPG